MRRYARSAGEKNELAAKVRCGSRDCYIVMSVKGLRALFGVDAQCVNILASHYVPTPPISDQGYIKHYAEPVNILYRKL